MNRKVQRLANAILGQPTIYASHLWYRFKHESYNDLEITQKQECQSSAMKRQKTQRTIVADGLTV